MTKKIVVDLDKVVSAASQHNKTLIISPSGQVGELRTIRTSKITASKTTSKKSGKTRIITTEKTRRETQVVELDKQSSLVQGLAQSTLPLFSSSSIVEFSHYNTGRTFRDSTSQQVRQANLTNKERDFYRNWASFYIWQVLDICSDFNTTPTPDETRLFSQGKILCFKVSDSYLIFTNSEYKVVEVVWEGIPRLDTLFSISPEDRGKTTVKHSTIVPTKYHKPSPTPRTLEELPKPNPWLKFFEKARNYGALVVHSKEAMYQHRSSYPLVWRQTTSNIFVMWKVPNNVKKFFKEVTFQELLTFKVVIFNDPIKSLNIAVELGAKLEYEKSLALSAQGRLLEKKFQEEVDEGFWR